MTRAITQEIINASAKATVRPFFAVEALFDSPNELRLWSGYGSIVIEGNTYTGAGELLKVSDIRESSDIAANGATLTLTGIPSSLVSLAIAEPYQGRVCKLKLGMIDETLLDESRLLISDTEFLIVGGTTDKLDLSVTQAGTFFDLFIGYMDQMNIVEGAETATITLAVESKMIELERARTLRYTDAGQQSRFSGDLAFQFVNRLQNETLTWGG